MKILTYITLLCFSLSLNAQNQSGTNGTQSQGEFFGLGSLGTNFGPSNPDLDNNSSVTPPRVSVKTYKLKANMFGGWWDFNFFNNLPTFTVKESDSIRVFGNELLNQVGGILNASLGKIGHFANGLDTSKRDVKGGQIEFRAGTKLLDPPNETYSEFLVPILQTSLDVKYLIPLTKEKNLDNIFGNLSFRVYATYMKIFRSQTYDEYFKTAGVI